MKNTLMDILQNRAKKEPLRTAFVFEDEMDEMTGEPFSWTWSQIAAQTRRVANILSNSGVSSNDRVLILCLTSRDFISALFGCMYYGAIGIPVYPPRRPEQIVRCVAIMRDAGAKTILTSRVIQSFMGSVSQRDLLKANWVLLDEEENEGIEAICDIRPNKIAFLQYTSGSTSDPKGVIVRNENLIANQWQIQHAIQSSRDSIFVSWLPLYHDMGLIGSVMQAVYVGFLCVLLSPVQFIKHPFIWLETVTKYRATHSGGPNFAYDLCVSKVSEDEKKRLCLNSWFCAYNGAEPIRAETLRAFSAVFSKCGFSERAFYPCYGLAEATLMVSGGRVGEKYQTAIVDIQHQQNFISENNKKEAIRANQQKEVVGCGTAVENVEIMIVNTDTLVPCAEGKVGEVWVKGPNIGQGYWGKPEEKKQVFEAVPLEGEGPYLRTGDIGFVRGGELFVTGRNKEILIIHGRNYYPQDIELIAEQAHQSIRSNACVVFQVEEDGGLVVMCGVDGKESTDYNEIVTAVRKSINNNYELAVETVILIHPRKVLRTTSGKIRRIACKEAFLRNEIQGLMVSKASDENQTANIEMPMIGIEKRLSELFSSVLEKNVTNFNADFFAQLGGDSIKAAEIANLIRTVLNVDIPLRALYDHPTIRDLALAITEIIKNERKADDQKIDNRIEFYETEAILPTEPYSDMIGNPKTLASCKNLLLTGATGFIGPYILAELLERTESTIYCLVRPSPSHINVLDRIREAIKHRKRGALKYFSRVVPIVGDLGLPKLGLNDETYESLVANIDAIINNGAYVDFLHTYARLRPTNIEATKELLSFSRRQRPKSFYHISTIAVFRSTSPEVIFSEDDEPRGVEAMWKGYAQSKWVAERSVRLAMAAGQPGTVFRVGLVSGQSNTGAGAGESLIESIILSCAQLGYAPKLQMTLDMTPVDFAARAIVEIGLRQDSLGEVYHITNPNPITLFQLYDWMNRNGYPVETEPYFPNWRERILNCSQDIALYPLLPIIEEQKTNPVWSKYSCQKMLSALKGTSIKCPPVDDNLLKLYFKKYERDGKLAKSRADKN